MTGVRRTGVLVLAVAVAALLTVFDTRLAAPQGNRLVALGTEGDVPVQEPFDPFWERIPRTDIALSAQQQVAPMGGHRWTISARAVHDDENLYVQLEWPDETHNRSAGSVDEFTDAVALEFPAVAGVQVPALCMGDPTASVNIWQWKAASQTQMAQGPQTTKEKYPNAEVDMYPFHDEETFYPGRAVGNPVSVAGRSTPVDNLVAGGFGTLTADPDTSVNGWGEWRDGKWRVVFQRSLAPGKEGNVNLPLGASTNAAFAVWDGAAGERDGMKSVGNFITLDVSSRSMPAGASFPYWPAPYLIWIVITVALGWMLLGKKWGGSQ